MVTSTYVHIMMYLPLYLCTHNHVFTIIPVLLIILYMYYECTHIAYIVHVAIIKYTVLI